MMNRRPASVGPAATGPLRPLAGGGRRRQDLGPALDFIFMTPFAAFFMRQFFLGISHETEEAARIEGEGHFRIFTRLFVPMSSASQFSGLK